MAIDPFLFQLGWNDFFQASFNQHTEPNSLPGRVTGQERGHYRIQIGPQEILEAAVTNKLRHAAKDAAGFPAVGDWIVFTRGQGSQQATIHQILSRKNSLQRKRSGNQPGIQLIATNIDFAFIVTSLNEDFDLDRIGRYITICKESGVALALLLTKADLCRNPEEYIAKCKTEFGDIELLLVSNQNPDSLQKLEKFFGEQKTCVLLGSSGVGKSTLTNYLIGAESQKTQTLSSESRGRHTTTSRNLMATRWGGFVIDTPGMQDIASMESEQKSQKDFSEIEDLALQCKFTNCQHKSEPGCAINAALKSGKLDPARWADFAKSNVPQTKANPRGR